MTNRAGDFGELAMNLHDQAGTLATVEGVLQFATEALPYDHASVMLMRRSRPETIAATDELITKADQFQIDFREGPSLLAISDHEDVLVDDTVTEDRWPAWAPTAAANGIRSLLAIRLVTAHSTSGVLNLVTSQPFVFTDADRESARLLALHASIAIASSRLEASLKQAVDSRKIVGQAVGRLMERYGLDAVQAFLVLRRYSQDSNQRLSAVATHVTATGKLPDRQPRRSLRN
jgi:GAF domain-containing protein